MTRRASEPNASKSKLSKSQKEDKELEELSAFFSRRTAHKDARAEERDLVDYGSHLRSGPRDTGSQFWPPDNGGRGSSHGSQQSYYRSIAIGEGEEMSRYSSSLPAIRSRDSGPPLRSRASKKPRGGSAWSEQYDDQAVGHESGSYYSGRARSGRSAPALVRDTLGESEPALAARAERRSHHKIRAVMRAATCKDAAAQTDLTPRVADRNRKQTRRPGEDWVTGNQSLDGVQYTTLASFRDNTQEASRPPIVMGGEAWPAPELPRYAPPTHVEPDADYLRFEEGGVPGRDISACIPDAGPLLCPPNQTAEHLGSVSQPLNPYRSHRVTDYLGGIAGNFGFENLEEFIRRIEGEAAMPPEKEVDDGATLTRHGFDVLSCPEPRPLALSGVANFDGADDTAFMPSSAWFALEPDPLAPASAGNPYHVAQEADLAGRTSLSMLESYSMEDQEEYPAAAAWQHSNAFY